MASSLGETQEEIARLVANLERFVLAANLRSVRLVCEELKSCFLAKSKQQIAIEVGAVQALLGALHQARRDVVVTEIVLTALLALGPTQQLAAAAAAGLDISIALLLRPEGLTCICRAGSEHKGNLKIQALTLRVLANCARDEQGSRMLVFTNAIHFLLDALGRLKMKREVCSLALFALASCTIFHAEARILLVQNGGREDLLALCREYSKEVDILEPSMCLLCMLSCNDEEDGLAFLGEQRDLDEIGQIALNALNVFALRTFEEAASTPSPPSPFDALKSRFQAATSTTSTPALPIVTSSSERRCSSWCLALLSNLAKRNESVRNLVIQTVVQAGVAETEVRYQRMLEKLLASCFDDVIANRAKEDEEDFVNLNQGGREDAKNGLASLRTMREEDLMEQVLLNPTPDETLLAAQTALLAEMSKTRLVPISLWGMRLLTLIFAMLQHPFSRAKLSKSATASLAENLLPSVRARSGENGEYFTLIAKQLEQRLGAASLPHHLPFRAFPLLADKQSNNSTATSKLVEEEEETTKFSLLAWRHRPRELCHQITLKMESLLAMVDPTATAITAILPDNVHTAAAVVSARDKFQAFHANLELAIKREILNPQIDADTRGALIETIIAIASYSATQIVSNLDLAMLCLTALHSKEIRRLKLSWKRVRDESKLVLQELFKLSAFQDLASLDANTPPPPLLQRPRIPYMEGFSRQVGQLQQQRVSYACLNWWFPHLSKNGDWYARTAQFAPLPNLQIALTALVLPPAIAKGEGEEEEKTAALLDLSKEVEPDWLIEQGEAHDALLLQRQIEQEIDSHGDALKHVLTIESARALVQKLLDELMHKKRLVRGKTAESIARLCLERIVFSPSAARLLLQAADEVAVEEAEFQAKLRGIKLRGSESWVEEMGIPQRFADLPWRASIAVLNAWLRAPCGSVSPSQAMDVLLNLKDEIFAEAKQYALKPKHLTAEDLIPIFILLVVRSDALNHHLYAQLHLIKTFLGDEELGRRGEALYYLVTLESAAHQIRTM